MSHEQRAVERLEIVFPNGNQADAVYLPSGASIQDALSLLHLPAFHNFIMIAGGAALMNSSVSSQIAHLFIQGIAHFAATHSTLIIDGGTQSGVMELMGTGIAAQHHRSPLLGVSPANLVRYPGQRSHPSNDEDAALLDPNHSHFVLVEANEWGGETATMYEVAHQFSQQHSSLAILINGGAIAIKEVLYNVRQQRPIIVIEGSGRAADDIAHLWREKPSMIANAELAEIIQYGNIHLFLTTNPVADLVSMTQTLLHS